MAEIGMFDKAKQMKEQAAQKAAELKEQAASKATNLKDAAMTKAGEVTDTVSSRAGQMKESVATKASEVKESVAQAAADAKDASVAKIKETVEDFNASLPVLREAGYQVSEVDIALGIPPKISASVTASSAVTPEHVEEVLAEHAERKFTVALVKALFAAWKLQNGIAIVGMKPRGMTIELGLIPSVTIKFVAA
ncbi:MAG TPA: hypothetical protein VHB21_12465 [Minicystis sp.]|nr:hypothetical protein [Minicystis sp.]